MNEKESKEEKTPFTIPINPKRATCETCKGIGKVKNIKCSNCGGSGSRDKINLLRNVMEVEKGTPQRKYEVVITDVEQNKILYKDTIFGGVLSSVEKINKFSASEVDGNFQVAMWGHPLIQRFAIDRLEEEFAKNIESYLDALELAGMFFTNREQMKRMMIEGNIAKLKNIMGMAQEELRTDNLSVDEANQHLIEKVKNILIKNGSFAIITIDNNQPIGSEITQQVEVMVKGLNIKQVLISVLESAVSAFAHQQGKTSLNNLEKAARILELLKDISKEIVTNLERQKELPLNNIQ